MARKAKVQQQDERYLESFGPDAAAYDACFETLDYTDSCDKCGADASDHAILPLREGGFDARCGVCGHVARG